MTPDTVELILKAIPILISVAVGIYAFFVNRRKDVDKRFEEGSKRMSDHSTRLLALEQTIKTMPGKDDIHALQLLLSGQTGELKEMRALMEGNANMMRRLENMVTRYEDHLIATSGGEK